METREANGIGFVASAWPLDSARPTLIFVHGSGGTHALWDGQVGALAGRANTVALDLPGRGLSSGAGLRSIPDYATVVADFIDSIDAPRPVPCGQSLGGGIVLQLLLDYPDRFAAGIVVASGARLRVMPAILEGIERDYGAHLSNLQLAISPRTDRELLAPILAANARCPAEVALGDFMACDAFDVMERLGEIHVPVLIASGEDDQLTPTKYADFLEKSIQRSHRTRIPDAGHLVPAERPEELNRAIRDFLGAAAL